MAHTRKKKTRTIEEVERLKGFHKPVGPSDIRGGAPGDSLARAAKKKSRTIADMIDIMMAETPSRVSSLQRRAENTRVVVGGLGRTVAGGLGRAGAGGARAVAGGARAALNIPRGTTRTPGAAPGRDIGVVGEGWRTVAGGANILSGGVQRAVDRAGEFFFGQNSPGVSGSSPNADSTTLTGLDLLDFSPPGTSQFQDVQPQPGPPGASFGQPQAAQQPAPITGQFVQPPPVGNTIMGAPVRSPNGAVDFQEAILPSRNDLKTLTNRLIKDRDAGDRRRDVLLGKATIDRKNQTVTGLSNDEIRELARLNDRPQRQSNRQIAEQMVKDRDRLSAIVQRVLDRDQTSGTNRFNVGRQHQLLQRINEINKNQSAAASRAMTQTIEQSQVGSRSTENIRALQKRQSEAQAGRETTLQADIQERLMQATPRSPDAITADAALISANAKMVEAVAKSLPEVGGVQKFFDIPGTDAYLPGLSEAFKALGSEDTRAKGMSELERIGALIESDMNTALADGHITDEDADEIRKVLAGIKAQIET